MWKSKNERAKSSRTFFLPVIALVYSVKEDVGYYAWVSEPHFTDDTPKLIHNEQLECTEIRRNSLDNVVQKVAEWYIGLATILLSA